MKFKSIAIKTAALTIFAGTLAFSLSAQPPDRKGGHAAKETDMVAPVPPVPPQPQAPPFQEDQALKKMHAPDLGLPDLTPEQQDKVRKADLELMKSVTPLRNQIMEKRIRLQSILATTPFDEKSAFSVADEIGKTETSLLKEMIHHDQSIRAILTPDQQIIFDARPKPFLKRDKRQ